MRKLPFPPSLIAGVLVLTFCLAASTSVRAQSTHGGGSAPLTPVFRGHAIPCPRGIMPNGLTVLRDSPPKYHFPFSVAAYGVSHRVAPIGELYAIVCALPPILKPQLTACGFSLDLPYHLRFFTGRRQLFQITAGYLACPADLFVGSTAWRGRPFFYGAVYFEFWHKVAHALGIQYKDLAPACHIDPGAGTC